MDLIRSSTTAAEDTFNRVSAVDMETTSFSPKPNVVAVDDEGEGPGVLETAVSFYQQETVFGGMYMAAGELGHGPKDPDFNVFRHYKENKEDLTDLDVIIRQGGFNNVNNIGQFDARVGRLRAERKNRDNMINGNGWGQMLGMGLSLIDIMTIVPIAGPVKKAKTAATAANYAVKGGAVVGAQEVALHNMQEFRTMDETVLNVLAGSILLGAVGGYKGMKAVDNTATVGANPARYATTPPIGAIADPDFVGPLPLVADDIELGGGRFGDDSAGAQRVNDGTTSVMDGNRGVVAKVLDKSTGWIDKVTPVGRSFNWSSTAARNVTQRLMDTGGRINKNAAEGQATINAETTKNAIKTEYDTLLLQGENTVINLNEAMTGKGRIAQQLANDGTRAVNWGQSVTGQAETFEMGLLKNTEFNELVVSSLHGYMSPEDLAKLEIRWGAESTKLIKGAVEDYVGKINHSNGRLEDLMVEHNLITDNMRMGNDYHMAQLWDSKMIREDTYSAKDFFLKIFQDEPAEDFILDYGMSLEDYAKLGLEDVNIKDLQGQAQVITKAEGQRYKGEILEDWSGNKYEKALEEIDQAAKAALDAEKVARKSMVEAAAIIRHSTTKIKNLSIKVAKDVVRTTYESINIGKAKRSKAQAELGEAQAEIRGKLEKEYAQQLAVVERGPTQQAINKTNGNLRKLMKVKGPLEQDPKAIRLAQEAVTEAEINHAVAIDDMWRSIKVNTPAMAKYKERALAARTQIRKSESYINKKQKRVSDLEVAVTKTEDAIKSTRALTKESRVAYKDMKSSWRSAKKVAKKAVRLKRTGGVKNMNDTVDDLVQGLQQNSKSPQGVLTEAMFEGGRSKSRTIRMNPEQTKEAHELGILKKDLHMVLDKQWEEVSARIALRKVFGNDVSLDLSDLKKTIESEYDIEITHLKGRNKKSSHLKNEKQKATDDVDGLLERLYGRAGMPDNPDDALTWTANKAREYNFTRFGPEFIVTSFTDAANMILTNGFGVYGLKYFKASSTILKDAPDDVIHKIAVASERLLHQARHLKLSGSDTPNQGMGIGATGSVKQKITANADRLMGGLNEKVNVMSGLGAWNVKQKAMTMIFQQDKLVDIVNNPNMLDDLTRAKLATIGIGPDQLALFKKMSKKHGISNDRGVKSFDAQNWQTHHEVEYLASRKNYEDGKKMLKDGDIKEADLDELRVTMEAEYSVYSEGREAYTSFVSSMRQAADRGIMTPGIGDTPLLMDGAVAKMLMQFQTYGFVIMNKMIAPAAQRMHHYKDADAVASMGMALALGGLVVITKDIIRNGEIKERSASEWTRDILDRSGALAWLSPYAAAIEKSTGLGVGGSRFQANNAIGQLFGPSFGLGADVFSGINAISDPERTDAADKLRRLAPYQALFKIADLTSAD